MNNKSRSQNYFSIFVIPVLSLLMIYRLGVSLYMQFCHTYTYSQYSTSLCKLSRGREIFVMYCITVSLLRTSASLPCCPMCLQLRCAWQEVGPFSIYIHTMFWRHFALLTHLMGRGFDERITEFLVRASVWFNPRLFCF